MLLDTPRDYVVLSQQLGARSTKTMLKRADTLDLAKSFLAKYIRSKRGFVLPHGRVGKYNKAGRIIRVYIRRMAVKAKRVRKQK